MKSPMQMFLLEDSSLGATIKFSAVNHKKNHIHSVFAKVVNSQAEVRRLE